MKANKIKNTNDKKLIYAIGIVLLLVVLSINIFSGKENDELKVGQDYYEYANKNILDNKDLKDDEAYWSLLATETQDKIDDKVLKIVNKAKNENENIGKLHNSVINQKNDLSIIDTYIQKIDNSKNIKEFLNNVLKINDDLSMGLLVNYTIESDYKNNEESIVNIYPFIFDFGTMYSDYYTNPIYSNYIGTYIKYDREILKLYGYSEEQAKETIRKISRFYMEIANNSKSMDEINEVTEIYNIQTSEAIDEIYTNIDIDKFLKRG